MRLINPVALIHPIARSKAFRPLGHPEGRTWLLTSAALWALALSGLPDLARAETTPVKAKSRQSAQLTTDKPQVPQGQGQGQGQGQALATSTKVQGPEPILSQPILNGKTDKGEDGLSQGGILIDADEIHSNDDQTQVDAKGAVETRHKGRIIRSDTLHYDSNTGRGIATGHVLVINADGSLQRFDRFEIDNEPKSSVGENFGGLNSDNTKIIAARVIHRSEQVNEFRNGAFTPCELCTPAGKAHAPTWSISAERVVQDKDKRVIYYRNAILKIRDIPVGYTPYLSHPDPSADAASGFLMPQYKKSSVRGISIEVPYLWVISKSSDLTVSPQFNEKVNPLLNTLYRKRFWTGDIEVRNGITQEYLVGAFDRNKNGVIDSGENNTPYGDNQWRGYILASGSFKPTKAWKWGFSAEHVSDPQFFDRYQVSEVYKQRGLYVSDTRRMNSQLYAVRQDNQSYLSVTAMQVQSLRFGQVSQLGGPIDPKTGKTYLAGLAGYDPILQTRVNDPTGRNTLVAPLIEAQWSPKDNILGGRLRLSFSSATVLREDTVGTAILPNFSPVTGQRVRDPGLDGTGKPAYSDTSVADSFALAQLDWRRNFTLPIGLRLSPFVQSRLVYTYARYKGASDLSDPLLRNKTVTVDSGQALGTAGLDVAYPFYRKFKSGTFTIQPMAQFAISPNQRRDLRLPYEDNRTVELDETNMFRVNRAAGSSLYESGSRFSVGVKFSYESDQGRSASFLMGQSFRDQVDKGLSQLGNPDPTNKLYIYPFADKASDYILAAQVKPFTFLNGYSRVLLDRNNYAIRRGEAGATLSLPQASLFTRYIVDRSAPKTPLNPQGKLYEDVQVGGRIMATKNWGTQMSLNYSIKDDRWRRSEISVLYQDDCITVEIYARRNDPLVPGQKVDYVFGPRITLATFGQVGYKQSDFR